MELERREVREEERGIPNGEGDSAVSKLSKGGREVIKELLEVYRK